MCLNSRNIFWCAKFSQFYSFTVLNTPPKTTKCMAMSDRYMPSIFPECDKLKQAYDKCFTNFFQHYINPNYRHLSAENPCQKLYVVYKDCVEKNLDKHKPYEIDLEELRKEEINVNDFLRSDQEQKTYVKS